MSYAYFRYARRTQARYVVRTLLEMFPGSIVTDEDRLDTETERIHRLREEALAEGGRGNGFDSMLVDINALRKSQGVTTVVQVAVAGRAIDVEVCETGLSFVSTTEADIETLHILARTLRPPEFVGELDANLD